MLTNENIASNELLCQINIKDLHIKKTTTNINLLMQTLAK